MKHCFLRLPERLKTLFHRSFFLTLAISTLMALSSVVYAAQVDLIWDPPDIEPAGYKVYYGTASASYTQSVDVGKTTSAVITGLEEGNTYYFSATAYYDNEPESGFFQ